MRRRHAAKITARSIALGIVLVAGLLMTLWLSPARALLSPPTPEPPTAPAPALAPPIWEAQLPELLRHLLRFTRDRAQAEKRELDALLERGAKETHDGEDERAIQTFLALLARAGDLPQGKEARLRLGRLYLSRADYPKALAILQEFRERYPGDERQAQVLFWLAEGQRGMRRFDEAIGLYREYLARRDVAGEYVRLEIAQSYLEAQRPGEAASELREVLESGLGPSSLEREARELLAVALLRQQDYLGAAAEYQRLLAGTGSPAERARLEFELAGTHRALGQEAQARELWTALVLNRPRTGHARRALGLLEAVGAAPLDPYLRGLVYYYALETDRALELFRASLQGQPTGPYAPAARYFLGLTYERKNQYQEALGQFQQMLAQSPSHSLAPDALWETADLLESLGRSAEAANAYRQLVSRYPASPLVVKGAFREGLLAFRQGQYQAALERWQSALHFSAEGEVRQQFLFWSGRALERLGQAAEAAQAWEAAILLGPREYYGLRARAQRGGQTQPFVFTPSPAESLLSLSGGDPQERQELETWLLTWAGAPEGEAHLWELGAHLARDPTFQRGEELLALGLRQRAQAEFREVLSRFGRNGIALYQLALYFQRQGLYQLSLSAALRLLNLSPALTLEAAPKLLQKLIYPTYFGDMVLAQAQKRGLDPLLLLSLIWQESLFEPQARSPANALGLTQVIPATAQEIAKSLGQADFQFESLSKPVVSLEFGGFYLAARLRDFQGNPTPALAGYNGGPGNARRWAQRAPITDLDLYLESIDFGETQRYLKKLYQHYEAYRAIYRS